MDFTGLLVLGALWFLLNLIGRKREGGARPPAQRPANPQRQVIVRPARPPASGDPTQREGGRLEVLLRELERTVNQGTDPEGRGVELPPPEAEEEEEEADSREAPPEVVSLETEVHRPARRTIARDDEAEQVEVRRVAAAEARGGALTRKDHAAFDQRIRQEPADHTAVRGYSPQQLKDAMVWREILGPPVSMRE